MRFLFPTLVISLMSLHALCGPEKSTKKTITISVQEVNSAECNRKPRVTYLEAAEADIIDAAQAEGLTYSSSDRLRYVFRTVNSDVLNIDKISRSLKSYDGHLISSKTIGCDKFTPHYVPS